ncbi:MAG: asparagine synthase (glutamine-hydrolyzing) [bacterium]|nr:asparagine synthase (glutamine-hydrolyzing) [bacterium]
MCGVCGVLALDGRLELPTDVPAAMIGLLRHRGPDGFGAWRDDRVFLGHARLAIIDPTDGAQPMTAGSGRCHIAYNGEVFNYLELRRELEDLGLAFRTRSDTEVILNAWQAWGPRCVERFNGQFAIAIWDAPRGDLFLARDRFGICPLFVATHGGCLLFASEAKALGGYPGFVLQPDPAGFAEVLAYWANIAPATCFRGVAQLPPGHWALVRRGHAGEQAAGSLPGCLEAHRYWAPSFLPAAEDRRFVPARERLALVTELRERLARAVTLRLRADVPVASYLSGGLDSAVIAAMARRQTGDGLRTYGLGFEREGYDERRWQAVMVEHLGVDHHGVVADAELIAARLVQATWHAETPLPRTAPAPLLVLSGAVHADERRVVLTGEGADEVFVGYDIHREAKLRAFWSRQPDSELRPALLARLHAFQELPPPAMLRAFYGHGLTRTDDPLYSHRPRWRNGAAGFLAEEARREFAGGAAEARLLASLPEAFAGWGTVARCQYLEMAVFMSGYLLASQGDRMLMANAVEGRFPYLDHELVEFAASIPVSAKLPTLAEKAMLRSAAAGLVPAAISGRGKHPYRAPGSASFAGDVGRAIVEDHLLADGPGWEMWDRDRVTALVRKWRTGRGLGQRDDAAFIAVLSGRMLQREFGTGFASHAAATRLQPGQVVWMMEGQGVTRWN